MQRLQLPFSPASRPPSTSRASSLALTMPSFVLAPDTPKRQFSGSSMLRLLISLGTELAGCYRGAMRRVRGGELTDFFAEAEAVIAGEAEAAQRALHCGKHALWIPGEDAKTPRIARSSQGRLMPAAAWRFRPSLRVIADRQAQGVLGDPGLLRIHRWTKSASLLADMDVACWLFMDAPEKVYAWSGGGYFQCHLGFKKGGMAIIDHATDLTHGGYESLTFIGAHGAAYADDHRNVNLQLGSRGCRGLKTSEGDVGLTALLDEFVAAIRDDRPFAVTMDDLNVAMDARDRVMRSAETKTVL